MEVTVVAGFAVVAFALIATPGPDWAYVLAVGARDHVVAPAVGGIVVGYALITALVVAGIGPLVATWPVALMVLTVAGAAYLSYLGVRTLRSSAQAAPVAVTGAIASSPSDYFLRGVGVSGMNPKGILIFLTVLPQFTVARTSWPLPVQLAVLGGVYLVITALVYLPLGFAADRVLGARPRVAQITTRVAGVAMILVAVTLLGERVVELALHGWAIT
ncbi:MAG: LysE family translocator [Tessaracoccus sp.]